MAAEDKLMSGDLRKCVICQQGEESLTPLFAEDFYPDTWYHLGCMQSQAGSVWVKAKQANDPLFKRFYELMTMGLPIRCPTCGVNARLYPKATGWAPYRWEMNCDRCHDFTVADFTAYSHPQITEQLNKLFDNFLRTINLDQVEGAIIHLAEQYDYLVAKHPCSCGGRFSIKARPRCKKCRGILLNTYFHYADRAAIKDY